MAAPIGLREVIQLSYAAEKSQTVAQNQGTEIAKSLDKEIKNHQKYKQIATQPTEKVAPPNKIKDDEAENRKQNSKEKRESNPEKREFINSEKDKLLDIRV